jgi:hypothetical protein
MKFTEMNIPAELLLIIASKLKAEDLGRFRLINQHCASIGTSLLLSLFALNGITLLNTATELESIRHLLKNRTIAHSIRKLTISYGNWPACTRKEWERHPLLFGGQARFQSLRSSSANKAFEDYSKFLVKERGRSYQEDLDTIFEVLNSLSNLRTITITQMQGWPCASRSMKYRNLQQQVWMTPYTNDQVSLATNTFLLTFSHIFPKISSFKIYGTFDTKELYNFRGEFKFFNIRELSIISLQVHENEETLRRLLQAFPNLIDLSVKFKGWDQAIPNVTRGLLFSSLKVINLDNLWASEEQIFTLFRDHQFILEIFSLGNTTIIQGSWRSLFTRIRDLKARVQININGELYGRTSKDTLKTNHTTILLLKAFLLNQITSWPFT